MKTLKSLFNRACMALVMASSTTTVWAAGHDQDFNQLYTQLLAWTTGSLGKSIALIFLLIGLSIGAVRGSILGAVTCIAAALALVVAPDIVDAIFTAP